MSASLTRGGGGGEGGEEGMEVLHQSPRAQEHGRLVRDGDDTGGTTLEYDKGGEGRLDERTEGQVKVTRGRNPVDSRLSAPIVDICYSSSRPRIESKVI
jgi:hypothetical protein